MALIPKLRLALVLFVTVAVPGVADYYLSEAGYDTLGMIVWIGGYGAGVLLIWLVWVRPLDLHGPV